MQHFLSMPIYGISGSSVPEPLFYLYSDYNFTDNLAKNKAVNAPIKFEKIIMVIIILINELG